MCVVRASLDKKRADIWNARLASALETRSSAEQNICFSLAAHCYCRELPALSGDDEGYPHEIEMKRLSFHFILYQRDYCQGKNYLKCATSYESWQSRCANKHVIQMKCWTLDMISLDVCLLRNTGKIYAVLAVEHTDTCSLLYGHTDPLCDACWTTLA